MFMRIARIEVVIFGALLSLSCAQDAASPPGTASAEPEPTAEQPKSPAIDVSQIVERLQHGLDVSVHSGSVDWTQVAAEGHTFAFIKATEGMDLKDLAFDAHWPALKQAGLIRGAYHFYVTEDDPAVQAQFFMDNVTLESGDLAPVVDIELVGHDTKPGWQEQFKVYLEIVEKHYAVKPIIYTSPNFWDKHFSHGFPDYPLWIAEYGVDQPRIPADWPNWHLWQWQGDARVAGVDKDVDLSRVNRSHENLAALVVP